MIKASPDCTGERFGMLTVLGKGSRHPKSNIQLWEVQCDCGKIIEIPRGYFEHNGQVSCGCKRSRRLVVTRKPHDIAGQKFGQLRAIALTGNKDNNSKPTWLFQCECGGSCELSLSSIRMRQYYGNRINCGDRRKHKDKWFHYPESPIPYPQDAADIVIKYWHLIKLEPDSAVEDKQYDELLRTAWIIAYRRRQGENISELYERRYIQKWLRYCSIHVFWQRKLDAHGGFLYNTSNKKKEIGIVMTDTTPLDYPVIETLGINYIPKKQKRLKFFRC